MTLVKAVFTKGSYQEQGKDGDARVVQWEEKLSSTLNTAGTGGVRKSWLQGQEER